MLQTNNKKGLCCCGRIKRVLKRWTLEYLIPFHSEENILAMLRLFIPIYVHLYLTNLHIKVAIISLGQNQQLCIRQFWIDGISMLYTYYFRISINHLKYPIFIHCTIDQISNAQSAIHIYFRVLFMVIHISCNVIEG